MNDRAERRRQAILLLGRLACVLATGGVALTYAVRSILHMHDALDTPATWSRVVQDVSSVVIFASLSQVLLEWRGRPVNMIMAYGVGFAVQLILGALSVLCLVTHLPGNWGAATMQTVGCLVLTMVCKVRLARQHRAD